MARRNAIAIVSVCLLVIIAGVFLLEVKQPGDITKKIGALAVILQGHPEAVTDIDQGEAVSKALDFMQAGDLANARIPVTGYRLSSAYHAFGLSKATTKDGRAMASWAEPKDVWVLEFVAPPQQGFAHVSAFVVVDASSGKVESYSEGKTN